MDRVIEGVFVGVYEGVIGVSEMRMIEDHFE